MLVSSLVDRGFIGVVMVSVLVSSLIDRGFIGGVMVRRARLESGRSWVHRWQICKISTIFIIICFNNLRFIDTTY